MRRVFVVVAKVVGVVQLYHWVSYFASIWLIFSFASDSYGAGRVNRFLQVAGVLGYVLLTLGVIWLLLLKTEWLADKLGIKEDDSLPEISTDVILRVGFQLVGLYMFLVSLPKIFGVIFQVGSYSWMGGMTKHIWSSALPAVLQVVLSLFLLIRTDMILKLIKKGEKAPGKNIFIGGCIILVVLTFIGVGVAKTKWGEFKPDYSSFNTRQSYSDGDSVTDENVKTDSTEVRDVVGFLNNCGSGVSTQEWYSLGATSEFISATNVPIEATRTIILPLP